MALLLCLAVLPSSLFAAESGQIIDFEGAEFGAAIPRWVFDFDSGDYKRLKKDLRLSSKAKNWIVSVKCPSLELASAQIDSLDIVSLVVQDVQKAMLDSIASDSELSAEEKELLANSLSEAIHCMSVTGLEKSTAFWLSRQQEGGIEYRYYAVFTMDKNVWSRQVSALLENIEGLSPYAKKAIVSVKDITIIKDKLDGLKND